MPQKIKSIRRPAAPTGKGKGAPRRPQAPVTRRGVFGSALNQAIRAATLDMPDGDYELVIRGDGEDKVVRVVTAKSKGKFQLSKGSKLFKNRKYVRKSLPTAPKVARSATKNPMEEVGIDELPFVDRDMGDVQAELHASLDPGELANRIGLSRVTVSNYRSKNKILGLAKGNRYVFPSWQLDKSGQLQPAMQDVLKTLHTVTKDPIDLLILMITGLDFFKSKSIKDFLIAGDTESALQEARMIAKI